MLTCYALRQLASAFGAMPCGYCTLRIEVEVEVEVDVDIDIDIDVDVDFDFAVDFDLFRIEAAAKSRSQAGDKSDACLSEASLRHSP
jgi:hypothetical protein